MIPLDDLIKYFESATIIYPIKLDNCTTVLNDKMIKTHIDILKSNPGNKLYKPYYDRLFRLYTITK